MPKAVRRRKPKVVPAKKAKKPSKRLRCWTEDVKDNRVAPHLAINPEDGSWGEATNTCDRCNFTSERVYFCSRCMKGICIECAGGDSVPCPGCAGGFSTKIRGWLSMGDVEPCPLRSKCPGGGCKFEGESIAEMYKHCQSCPKVPIICPNKSCKKCIVREEQPAHNLKCQNRSAACPFCSKAVPDLEGHIKTCALKDVKCAKKCGEVLPNCLMACHKAHSCPFKDEMCQICRATFSGAYALNEHLNEHRQKLGMPIVAQAGPVAPKAPAKKAPAKKAAAKKAPAKRGKKKDEDEETESESESDYDMEEEEYEDSITSEEDED